MTDQYIELHARSAFSFLEGASLPEELAATAAGLDIPALALLDRDGVYAAPRFHLAANKAGIRAHIGAEVTAAEGGRYCLLVRTRQGYRNLCRLLTRMKLRAKKGEGAVTREELADHAAGLLCLAAGERAAELIEIFGRENLYAELERHLDREQEARNQQTLAIARRLHLPVVATNGVCYATSARREVLDVLTAIRHKTRLPSAGRKLARNAERRLKPAAAMRRLFADLPEAIANTVEVSSRLEFTLADLGYEFPRYPVPEGESMNSFLRRRTDEGARRRYRPYHQRARLQIERELALIEKLGLAGYFLIVWDIVEFCRREGILAQGRGSAANSAVCYSLGITAVDPVGMDLLFERFLSEERGEWPDIDLDLPSGDQRERVIQHVYQRHGQRGAAMTANVITYRGRLAAREVGKALEFDEDTVARLAGLARAWEWKDPQDSTERQFRDAGLDLADPRVKKFFDLYLAVQDLPRHLGQHSGGMVICQGSLDAVVPLEPASMPGRVVVQWDKDDCAAMGIIKVDLLGLGMMAAIEEMLETIRDRYGEQVSLAHLPPDDPAVYQALQKADTIGMFQVESRAQMASLPRLCPKTFYDIVVQVAIIRPGPIVGQMVHPYINRRQGREPAECLHPSLEPVLRRTLGVPLFQEQLLRIAMIAAGFTGGEAEELRRAMGFKRSEARMREIEVKLRRGMDRNSITGAAQDRIVQAIAAFALYGFPESHAASFALLAYASAYLKCHYLAAFTAALLNNQPMGFYHPSTIIKDAQRHGLKILPIDVTRSEWRSTVEAAGRGSGRAAGMEAGPFAGSGHPAGQGVPQVQCAVEDSGGEKCLRLGLSSVKGLREEAGQAIVRERQRGPFTGIDELVRRVPQLRKDEVRKLAQVGALNRLEAAHRRDALWQAERAALPPGPLFEGFPEAEPTSPLAAMTAAERLIADFRGAGLTLGRHPMAYRRAELDRLRVRRAAELASIPTGRTVRVAGLVIVRQRPGTAKGFLFLSLEDETGIINAIVTPGTYEANRQALAEAPFLLLDGVLQNQDNAVSVKVRRVQPLAAGSETPPSRDFH